MNAEIKNIGVFFGSRSPEHDVSIITGQLIISGLRGLGYEVVPVYLSKKGEWLLGEGLGELKIFTDAKRALDVKKFGKWYLDLEESTPSSPARHASRVEAGGSSLDLGGENRGGGKLVFRRKGLGGKRVAIDLAFPAFHGANGEDGTIQGLFEIFNIPYVGCDVTSSAITMDKILTKQFYREEGIATTNFLYYDKRAWQADKNVVIAEVKKELRWPVFVKPARLGSSIGMSKAITEKDLEMAIEVALHYGPRVIVEESVENLMDVTCAILGNDEPVASFLQESVFSDELFSYEEKYLKEGGAQLGKAQSKIVIPARLDERTTIAIQEVAKRIYQLFGCSGTARVDFLYDKRTKKFYANEVNTLPGTLYHHLWQKSGIEFPVFLERLLQLALDRHRDKQDFTSIFKSDILRQANSAKLRFKKTGGG